MKQGIKDNNNKALLKSNEDYAKYRAIYFAVWMDLNCTLSPVRNIRKLIKDGKNYTFSELYDLWIKGEL